MPSKVKSVRDCQPKLARAQRSAAARRVSVRGTSRTVRGRGLPTIPDVHCPSRVHGFGKGAVPISASATLWEPGGKRLRGDAGDMVENQVELQDWPNAITDGVATTPVSF